MGCLPPADATMIRYSVPSCSMIQTSGIISESEPVCAMKRDHRSFIETAAQTPLGRLRAALDDAERVAVSARMAFVGKDSPAHQANSYGPQPLDPE